jgi:hypothetical protein
MDYILLIKLQVYKTIVLFFKSKSESEISAHSLQKHWRTDWWNPITSFFGLEFSCQISSIDLTGLTVTHAALYCKPLFDVATSMSCNTKLKVKISNFQSCTISYSIASLFFWNKMLYNASNNIFSQPDKNRRRGICI